MATKRSSPTTAKEPGKPAAKAAAKKAVSAAPKTAAAKPAPKKAAAPAVKPVAKKAAAPAAKTAPKKAAAPAAKTPAAKTPAPAAKAAAKKAAAPAPAAVKPAAKGKTDSKPAGKTKAPVVSLRTFPQKKAKGGLAGGIAPYKGKKGENYMNAAQKAHFRSLLLAWKNELMEEVDRTVSHMKDEATNFPDPADRATQEEEFSLELRARDRERKLIKKIDSTLELIEQDDYGYCEACGIEIGVERLEVRPTATLCIDCKTLAEIKEKQTGA